MGCSGVVHECFSPYPGVLDEDCDPFSMSVWKSDAAPSVNPEPGPTLPGVSPCVEQPVVVMSCSLPPFMGVWSKLDVLLKGTVSTGLCNLRALSL